MANYNMKDPKDPKPDPPDPRELTISPSTLLLLDFQMGWFTQSSTQGCSFPSSVSCLVQACDGEGNTDESPAFV